MTASINVSPSMTFIRRSTPSSGLSRRLSKKSSRQRNDYGLWRDDLNPSKRRWKLSFRNSWGRVRRAPRTKHSRKAISEWWSLEELKNPEPDDQEADTSNQEITPITTTSKRLWTIWDSIRRQVVEPGTGVFSEDLALSFRLLYRPFYCSNTDRDDG